MELVRHQWVDGEETIPICWDFAWNLLIGRAQFHYIRNDSIHAAVMVNAPSFYEESPELFMWEVSYSVSTGKVKELTLVPRPAKDDSSVIDVQSREAFKMIDGR